MKNNITQFLKYGIGGGFAFVATFFSLYFLTEKLKIYYLLSSVIAYTIGFIINFIFQAWITFETKKSKIFSRLGYFSIIQIIGLLLFTFFMFIFTEKLNLLYLISYIFSAIISFIFNFSLSKIFAFNQNLTNAPDSS
ncbi:MAG: GtrA family protein [Patescibacteria group bacterium]